MSETRYILVTRRGGMRFFRKAKPVENKRLPECFLEKNRLDRMPVGVSGYVTPWNMWVDHDLRCWLNASMVFAGAIHGTVCMRVERQSDGYHVWPPETFGSRDGGYTWSPGKLGTCPEDRIPVAYIHTGPTLARSLPQKFITKNTLVQMPEGSRGFTQPWGMWVDLDLRCWLHPDYCFYQDPRGTARMLVERHADGYHVLPPSDEKYEQERNPGFVGSPPKEDFIPVVRVHER